MENNTTSPADTPRTAEPSGDGFFRVVNSQSVVLAQKCVKEEAILFAAAPEMLAACKEWADIWQPGKKHEASWHRLMNAITKAECR